MDEMRCFTATCKTRYPSIVEGITLPLQQCVDGGFAVGHDGSMSVHVDLLTSPFTLLRGDNVTFTRVGLKRTESGRPILVPPKLSDAPHVPGLTGVATPALIWFPEVDLRVVDRNDPGIRETVAKGFVFSRIMSRIWVEWFHDRHHQSAAVETYGTYATIERNSYKCSTRIR